MSSTPLSLLLGLALAVLGQFLLLAALRLRDIDSLSLVPPLLFWLLALAVLVAAATGSPTWNGEMGVVVPTWRGLVGSFFAITLTVGMWPLLQRVQQRIGGMASDQTPLYQKIIRLSFGHRLFLVLTAALVEEFLYRGYAIGMGQSILGSLWAAVFLSVAAFTLAHFKWGLSHLISILWVTLVLSSLFILTRDLFACVLAHAVVDAVGFLISPVIKANQTNQRNQRGQGRI